MKFLKYVLYTCTIAFSFSCSDFLSETSPDIVIPTTVVHYEELLYGEGYPIDQDVPLDFLTDDTDYSYAQMSNKQFENLSFFSLYTFRRHIDQYEQNKLYPIWEEAYKAIATTNIVIQELSKMSEKESGRDHVLGQAYILRALHYFTLMNYFGAPAGWKDKDEYGVPIILKAEAVIKAYPRNKASEVYSHIKEDLTKGLELIDKNIRSYNPYELNYLAALAIDVRIHLNLNEYERVKQSASTFFKYHNTWSNMNEALSDGKFLRPMNKENVFLFGGTYSTITMPFVNSQTGSRSGYRVDDDLLALYEVNLEEDQKDLRYDWFFITPKSAQSNVYPKKSEGKRRYGLRTAEVVISLAEAELELENIDGALQNLNLLRKNRIINHRDIASGGLSKEALRQMIRNERRKEFCFEDVRWLDLRRYNDTDIVHKIEDKDGAFYIKLKSNDWGYILQVPEKEVAVNTDLKLVPGEDVPFQTLNK